MMLSLQAVRLPLAHFELDVTFEAKSQATGIFGPSGAGKTSVLELIAGIRRPASGRMIIDGGVVDDASSGVHVPARRRAIGYVPQGDSLFPHMTVDRNIRFGVRPLTPTLSPQAGRGGSALRDPSPREAGRGWREAPGEGFIQHVIDVLEIGPLLKRGVGALSAGEAKRVALARALVTSPRLLLLDEPLAGLDRPLHGRVIEFLVRVRDELRVPMIYVSHDPAELRSVVADVVVILRGRVVGHHPAVELALGV